MGAIPTGRAEKQHTKHLDVTHYVSLSKSLLQLFVFISLHIFVPCEFPGVLSAGGKPIKALCRAMGRAHSYPSQLNPMDSTAITCKKNHCYHEITFLVLVTRLPPSSARKLRFRDSSWLKIQRFCNGLVLASGFGFWWCGASLC